MTHPVEPARTTARFDTLDAEPHVEVDGHRWPLTSEQAALGPTYPLVVQLYDITGRWHILPHPKVADGPRPAAQGAHQPEPGVIVVDVEEVIPPED